MKKWMLISALVLGMNGPAHAEEANENDHYRGVALNAAQIKALGLEFVPLEPVTEIKGYAWPAMVDIPLAHRDMLSAPVSGRVSKIHVVHGEVKAGQPLIELDSAELVTLQQQYLDALAQLQQAQKNFDRAQRLYKAGSLSQKQYLAARTALETAQNRKLASFEALLYAGLSLKQIKALAGGREPIRTLTLRAPKDGLLFDLQVERNQRVAAGDSLAHIGEIGEVVVDVDLPIEVARKVHLGQKVVIAHRPLEGKVAYVSQQADPTTQRVKVHVLFDNRERSLLPGEFVRVHFIEQDKGTPYYRVPATSIVSLDGTPSVFLKEAEHMEAQPVEIRYRDNSWAVVQLRGVQEDARQVVSHGAIFLKGMLEGGEEGDE